MTGGQNQPGQDQMEEMLSIGEAADFIGVSVDTLRRWSKKKRVITYRSPGGHRYYKKKDLVGLFDTKYTRDEETIRSSQEKTEEPEKLQTEEAIKEENLSEPENMTIPQMQPIKVLSETEGYQNLPVPDITSPPPPIPVMQSHIEVQTVTVEQTQTTFPQYYRQPAGPINKQEDETEKTQKEDPELFETVISDFTTGGGFEQERQTVETTSPSLSPLPEPEPPAPSTPINKIETATEIEEIDIAEEEVKDEQPEPDQVSIPHPVTQEEKIPVATDESEDNVFETAIEEKITEDDQKQESLHHSASIQEQHKTEQLEPAIPTSASSQQQDVEKRQDKKTISSQEEFLESKKEVVKPDPEPEKFQIAEKLEQKADVQKEEKIIIEKAVTATKAQEEKDEQTETTIHQGQKRSILEPEGIDASHLNKIEKMQDDSWFAKNKSNILIGFTVFLLIDIILFVIWLTTSRLLSPIP